MEKPSINETSLKRAWKDTRSSMGDIWFWVTIVLIGGAFAFFDAGALSAGALLLVAILEFGRQWFLAPYKQRDELRTELIEAQQVDSLADRLEQLEREIRVFLLEFNANMPAPKDHLNYTSRSMQDSYEVEGRCNTVVGVEADDFQARLIGNLQQERLNYEKKSLSDFHQKLGPKALSRLRKAAQFGVVPSEMLREFEDMMNREFLGNSALLYHRAALLCSEAATSLRERD